MAERRRRAPSHLGPYLVEDEIGRGGGGVVYRARREGSGWRAALKTVLDPDPLLAADLRREYYALARLDHEGVVRVLDEGVTEARPWYAMELLSGATLREYAAACRQGVRASVDLLRALQSVAVTLAYLHGEGIVHRDLKPENVLVCAGGRTVLLDFGLVTRHGRGVSVEEIEVSGDVVGSAAYRAPEQWRGEAVDGRADVYALGVILYEMLSGRLPFATEEDIRDPSRGVVPLSSMVPDLDASLDDLVARMLAKEPRRRLGYSEEVARALSRVVGGGDPVAEVRPHLHRPTVVGREAALARADHLLAELERGHGGSLFFEGEVGSGKSRLAAEIAARARLRGCHVLVGLPAAASESASPAGAAKRRLLALAREHPVVLLLDDLQSANDEAMELMALLRKGRQGPILVVGLWRAGESEEVRHELEVRCDTERCVLPRLGGEAVGAMVADMLSMETPPATLASLLAEQSEGNPLFVTEYLHAALATGLIVRDASGWRVEGRELLRRGKVPLPASLRDLVARRLDVLGTRAHELAGIASVLGRSTDVATVVLVAGWPEPEVRAALAELHTDRVVEHGTGDIITFAHELFQETAHTRLPETQRRELHRRAAEVMEARGAAEDAALGRHWSEAGDPARARRHLIAAARRAATSFASRESEALYRKVLELVLSPRETLEARLELGRSLQSQGRYRDALSEQTTALKEARRLGDRPFLGSCLAQLGNSHGILGQPGPSRACLQEALAIYREVGDLDAETHVLANFANVEKQEGRFDAARELYLLAIERARQSGDARAEGMTLGNLANLCQRLGNTNEAAALYEQALEIGDREDDRELCDTHLGNLAALRTRQGRLGDARHLYHRALAVARDLGDRLHEGLFLGSLASIESFEGFQDEAEALSREALQAAQEVDDPGTEGILLAGLGAVRYRQGRFPEAHDLHQKALALARQTQDQTAEASHLKRLGDICTDENRLDEGAEHYERALTLARSCGERRVEAASLAGYAALIRQTGRDFSRASQMLAKAEAILRDVQDPLTLVACLCEQGQLALARGADATPLLAEVDDLVPALDPVRSDSDLGRLIGALRRGCSPTGAHP